MKKALITITIFFFYCFTASAQMPDVIINEIAWMGTINSPNDEWIELYNNGNTAINLEGWILKAEDGTLEINLSETIPGQGFFLLERTDDNAVPNVSADLIYKGALGNDGENLGLYSASGSLIDQVNFSDGWPAGDNTTKQTMERIDSDWQTSQEPGGTPKAENSKTTETQVSGEIPKSVENEPQPIYPAGIVFNEILPSPEGPDEENEWIEIYNENSFEVNLSGWQIKDSTGKTAVYILSQKIPALGFLFFSRPETKITLNNDGDGLNLINPKGEIADSITFGKAFLNQSYAKTPSGWAWTKNLTPGERNIIPQVSQPSQSLKSLQSNSIESSKFPEVGPREISDISLSGPARKSQFFVFLVALIVALFCSIAFLIIKNNLKDRD